MAEPEISVVVPVYDEADNVVPLAQELRTVLHAADRTFELIFVDDGSTDGTAARAGSVPDIRVLRHPRNRGQSAATITGMRAARGDLILTLDGDGQNDPASIPDLLAALADADVAVGFRVNRQDTASRRAASRIAYRIRNLVLHDRIRDIGCSLRVFPREEAARLPEFDGLHRLMPALFVFRGLRVAQVPTRHRARTAGRSKYGNLKRGARGLFDLVGLYWLKRRMFRRD
jgi:dolichol-phosphate mannosyltransferase